MKLSIIIPYYNGEKWVAKCLDSLLHQDLAKDEYEIIVVDDGSTGDIRILKEYVQSHTNIQYIWQENKGISGARNKGLTVAKGELVFFCDCDDFIAENALGQLYNIAKTNDTDVLFFNYKVIKEGVQPQPQLNFEQVTIYDPGIKILLNPPYQTTSTVWSYIIKRNYIERRHLLFNEEIKTGEDYYYYREMMLDVGKVCKVEAEVYYYVMHSSSVMHTKGKGLKKRYRSYENGLYKNLCHLREFRNHLTSTYKVPIQVSKDLEISINNSMFGILIFYFRYYSFKDNIAIIRRMDALGFFPIHHRYLEHLKCSPSKRFVLKTASLLINIKPLWLTVCALFHCLPKKVRALC